MAYKFAIYRAETMEMLDCGEAAEQSIIHRHARRFVGPDLDPPVFGDWGDDGVSLTANGITMVYAPIHEPEPQTEQIEQAEDDDVEIVIYGEGVY